MLREDMVECGGLVGRAVGMCECERPDLAIPLLLEALVLLQKAPTEARQKASARQNKYRESKEDGDAPSHPVTRDKRNVTDVYRDPEVEEEVVVVEVEEGEEAVEGVEVAAKKKRKTYARDVGEVYDHYLTHHPRSAPTLPSSDKNYRSIVSTLKTGRTVADCCEAIDGYHRSPFHTGVNDRGQKYLGLDLIFRDADHVTKGIEMASDVLIDSGIGEKARKGIHATQRWIERHEGGGA